MSDSDGELNQFQSIVRRAYPQVVSRHKVRTPGENQPDSDFAKPYVVWTDSDEVRELGHGLTALAAWQAAAQAVESETTKVD